MNVKRKFFHPVKFAVLLLCTGMFFSPSFAAGAKAEAVKVTAEQAAQGDAEELAQLKERVRLARLKAKQEAKAAHGKTGKKPQAQTAGETKAAKLKAKQEAQAEANATKQKAMQEAQAAKLKDETVVAQAAPVVEQAAPVVAQAVPVAIDQAVPLAEPVSLRFDINGYNLEGATLLTQAEIDAAVAPFTGKGKDFTDVQRALEAVEEAYSSHGFSAVRVVLPEQELEKGTVRFQVMESRFGKVKVKDNHFVSEANVLNALPSVRSGGVPKSKQISHDLRFANENPARLLNVVLKAGEKENEVDADVIVTDVKPSTWGLTMDNTGTTETGRARLGLSYRHANVFDADHVASLQYQTSPSHTNRVTVLSGSYKIPLYQLGDSVEFTGGYSNVNAILGGLDAVKGGGSTFGAHYNHPLEKMGGIEPLVTLALDWREFTPVYFNNTLLTPKIAVTPLSVAYSAQGKLDKSEVGFNAAFSTNLPGAHKGTVTDFASYSAITGSTVKARYQVLRYGASYAQPFSGDWKLRIALNGQYSPNTLIQGEQIRLGGADAVRGFSEGSVGSDKGLRWNLEGYTPDFGKGDFKTQALVFFDTGETRSAAGVRSSISSAGFGLRGSFTEQYSLRLDVAHIINADTDPLQRVGDWRAHFSLLATF